MLSTELPRNDSPPYGDLKLRDEIFFQVSLSLLATLP